MRNQTRALVVTLGAFALVACAHAEAGTPAAAALYVLGSAAPLPMNTDATQAVVGGALQLEVPLGGNGRWTLAPGAEYGTGSSIGTVNSPTRADRIGYQVTAWAGSLDLLYASGPADRPYCRIGAGLFCSRSQVVFVSTGSPDAHWPIFGTAGGELRCGGGIPVGPKLVLVGDVCSRLGRSSEREHVSGEDRTYRSTTLTQQARIGIRSAF
jgi:hypothetical protein